MMKELYQKHFEKELVRDGATALLRRENNAEQSSISFFYLMPGMELAYNFFRGHQSAEAEPTPETKNMIEINHCRQGRFGCTLPGDQQVYLGTGEIGANILGISRANAEFPLGFYEGITILLDVPTAMQSLHPMFPVLADQIQLLKQQLEESSGAMMIQNIPELNHVFEELYHVNPQIEQTYLTLKTLEILLTMQLVPYARDKAAPRYYKHSEMERIKALHRVATQNLEQRMTFAQLAAAQGFSLSGAKEAFKQLYGEPYASYMKKYRMHKALHYLENTTYSIAEIAGKVGYDNPSKFSSAFQSVVGCTPREYRNNPNHLEHFAVVGVEIEE